MTMYFK